MNQTTRKTRIKTFPHPVDSGWSWIVLLATFTIFVTFGGILRSFGIYMVEFLTYYDTDSSSTSLLIGLQFASSSIGGFLSTTIGFNYFSPRQIIMIGGLIGSIGLILNSCAQSIYFFIFSHSILVGIAIGLMLGPCLFSLGKYFDKRKSLANGVTASGMSLGGLIMGPLSRYLIDTYGIKGAFMIIGAIHLHTIVAAALIRPETFYRLLIEENDGKCNDFKNTRQQLEERDRKTSDGNNQERNMGQGARQMGDPINSETFPFEDNSEQLGEFYPRTNTSDSFSKLAKKAVLHHTRSRTQSEVVSVEKEVLLLEQTNLVSNSHGDIPNKFGSKNKKIHSYISNEYLFDIFSAVEMIRTLSEAQMVNNERSVNTSAAIVRKNKLKFFFHALCDCSIFKNSAFAIFYVSYLVGSIGCFYPIIFIPVLADFNGISKTKQSLLICIASVFDVFGRTGSGFLADRGLISRKHIMIIALSVCGTINGLNSFYTEFWSLCLYSVIYGVVGGTIFAINSSTLYEIIGAEKFGQGVGLMTAGQQTTLGISGSIAGALRDVTGRYDATFYFFGAGNLLAAASLSIDSIYLHFSTKQRTPDQVV